MRQREINVFVYNFSMKLWPVLNDDAVGAKTNEMQMTWLYAILVTDTFDKQVEHTFLGKNEAIINNKHKKYTEWEL